MSLGHPGLTNNSLPESLWASINPQLKSTRMSHPLTVLVLLFSLITTLTDATGGYEIFCTEQPPPRYQDALSMQTMSGPPTRPVAVDYYEDPPSYDEAMASAGGSSAGPDLTGADAG
ncbi:hypothetical protein FOZ63_004591, partial [Perkinsus olseni]